MNTSYRTVPGYIAGLILIFKKRKKKKESPALYYPYFLFLFSKCFSIILHIILYSNRYPYYFYIIINIINNIGTINSALVEQKGWDILANITTGQVKILLLKFFFIHFCIYLTHRHKHTHTYIYIQKKFFF